jgi:predicted RNase H-like nuclease (RuvC/YqgF family)
VLLRINEFDICSVFIFVPFLSTYVIFSPTYVISFQLTLPNKSLTTEIKDSSRQIPLCAEFLEAFCNSLHLNFWYFDLFQYQDDADNKIAGLRSDLNDKVVELSSANKELKSEINSVEASSANSEAEIGKLQSSVAAVKRETRIIKSLKLANESLTRQLASFKSSNSDLRADIAELQRSVTTVKRETRAIKSLKQANKRLSTQLTNFKGIKVSNDKLVSANMKLKNAIESLKAQSENSLEIAKSDLRKVCF